MFPKFLFAQFPFKGVRNKIGLGKMLSSHPYMIRHAYDNIPHVSPG